MSLIHKNSKKSGFTLVEIMVAVSIFVIVALIATGAFISANQINKQAQAIKIVMDNLSFALNSITLKMKQGRSYQCITNDSPGSPTPPAHSSDPDSMDRNAGSSYDCADGGTAVAFVSPEFVLGQSGRQDTVVLFRLFKDQATGFGRIQIQKDVNGVPGEPVPITAENINVQSLKFYVLNYGSDTEKPRALMVLSGEAFAGVHTVPFALQTSITARN
jgi:prepilin-type N-terminal cleavage/methylation domain-containing protein